MPRTRFASALVSAVLIAGAALLAWSHAGNSGRPSPKAHTAALAQTQSKPGKAPAQRNATAAKPIAKKTVAKKVDQAPAVPVVVAVIDGGVDISHPRLVNNLWVNRAEIAGNGIDDDNDGIVDDVVGANLAAKNADLNDDTGHGTHVSGIILQAAPNARIMSLKAGKGEWIDIPAATQAVYYAVNHGARVINLSWAFLNDDGALGAAIHYATAHNVLVVAAAGNFGFSNDMRPVYPASYRQPGLLAVAATCEGHTAASFSNFGKMSVDLAAPGCDINSTLPGNRYGRLSGTSMAAPAVAGAAARLLEGHATATIADLTRAVLGGAQPESGLAGVVSSGATLNLSGAVQAFANPDRTAPRAFAQTAPSVSFVTQRDPSYYYQDITFSWRASGDNSLVGYLVMVDGVPVAAASPDATSVTAKVAPGSHSWSVVAYDLSGNQTPGTP